MMKTPIQVLICDDERYSRDELKHLLSLYSNIIVIDEADSGDDCVTKTIRLKPDVVFIDVEMPKMNGIEAAKALRALKNPPLIVFATAYPNFAADAFRVEAVDYILKPFEEEQLDETLQRLERLLSQTSNQSSEKKGKGKLAIEGHDDIIYLDPEEIYYISRNEGETQVVLKEKEYFTKSPLKDIESRLKEYPFFRIHKSYLVNLNYVSRLIPWFNGAYQLELKDRKEQLSVSRNYIKSLRSRLEL